MNKYTEIYGVDNSKDVFDVVDTKGRHVLCLNDPKGFKTFSGHILESPAYENRLDFLFMVKNHGGYPHFVS